MRILFTSIVIFLFSISLVQAAVDESGKKVIKSVTYDHVLNWSLGLAFVLCLFFACIWFMRKTGALPINSKENMKVLAGLSLGMREKLILVQVGEKQLVLGVTPGRISNLLVLEGDDQLFKESSHKAQENDFSQKLKQIITGTSNE